MNVTTTTSFTSLSFRRQSMVFVSPFFFHDHKTRFANDGVYAATIGLPSKEWVKSSWAYRIHLRLTLLIDPTNNSPHSNPRAGNDNHKGR